MSTARTVSKTIAIGNRSTAAELTMGQGRWAQLQLLHQLGGSDGQGAESGSVNGKVLRKQVGRQGALAKPAWQESC